MQPFFVHFNIVRETDGSGNLKELNMNSKSIPSFSSQLLHFLDLLIQTTSFRNLKMQLNCFDLCVDVFLATTSSTTTKSTTSMTEILIPVSTETSRELVEKAIIPENGKKKIFVILEKKISELHLKNRKMTKKAIALKSLMHFK